MGFSTREVHSDCTTSHSWQLVKNAWWRNWNWRSFSTYERRLTQFPTKFLCKATTDWPKYLCSLRRWQDDISSIDKWVHRTCLPLILPNATTWWYLEKKAYSLWSFIHWGYTPGTGGMFEYLGVILGSDLSFSQHIYSGSLKSRKVIGLLYRRFHNYASKGNNISQWQQVLIATVPRFGCHV